MFDTGDGIEAYPENNVIDILIDDQLYPIATTAFAARH